MGSIKTIYMVIPILIMASLLTPVATAYTHGQTPNEDSIYVTDALGRTIVLNRQPHRVISLAPSITEMIFYFHLQDVLIGVDSISYNDTYLNISSYVRTHNVSDVGGYWWSAVKTEEILALKPDLVLADKGAHTNLLQFFQDYNITVVYLNAGGSRSLQDIYQDTDILDTIFSLGNETTSFINNIENSFTKYRELLKPYWGLKVLVVVGIYNGIWVAGKSTYIDDILARLGLVNAADIIGWKAVSIERIASWQPDIILVTMSGLTRQQLEEAGLYDLGVKIVLLNDTETNILSRPGPQIMSAPQVIYVELSSNLPITTTPSQTRTPIPPTTSSSPSQSGGSTTTTTATTGVKGWENNTLLLATASIIALLVGILTGYLVFKKVG